MQRYDYFLNLQIFSRTFFVKNEKFSTFMTKAENSYTLLYNSLLSLSEDAKEIDKQVDEVEIEREGS